MSSKTTILNALLIDGNGGVPAEEMCIVLENEKIHKIGKIDIKTEGRVIDAAGRAIIPGLIDCHVHYGGTRSPNARDWILESDTQQAIVSVAQAQKSLLHGFTTVRDISANGIYLRDMINSGVITGPRIVACGRGLSRTGGHGDSFEVPIELAKKSHPWAVICDGEEEVRKAVRGLIREGADWIKVWATGGGLWDKERETDQHYSYKELCTLVEEADYLGMPVCSHCESSEGALASIKAGVASIEHGEELTQECLRLMKEKDITLVPTAGLFFEWFSKYDPPARDAQKDYPGQTIRERELNRIRANFKAAKAMGIRIAVGADSFCDSLTPYGEYTLKEIRTLVDLGMTPMEALVSATKAGAELLRLDKLVGTLEVGKSADLVMLNKNPLEDIGHLSKENIALVMKAGNVICDEKLRNV